MKDYCKKRRKFKIIGIYFLAALILLFAVGLRRRNLLEGHTDIAQWHEQSRFIPLPLNLGNGDFELPRISEPRREIFGENNADIAGDQYYLRNWNILPLVEEPPEPENLTSIDPGSPYSVELVREEGQSGQYLVLDGGNNAFLFQNMQASAGARIYYGFSHKSVSERSGALDLYLNANQNPVLSVESDGEWRNVVRRYLVPDAQEEIKIGFAARRAGSRVALDKVWAKTGASLIVERSSDKDAREGLYPGEIVCYTITIRNYGQTAASELNVEDVFSEDVEFLGLAETQNIVVESAERDPQGGKISFRIDQSRYLEGVESGEGRNTAKISYYVKAGEGANRQLRSQTGIHYNDQGYESMRENFHGYLAYSDVHSGRVVLPPATSSVAVSLLWEGEDPDRPESVPVRLYRDGLPYSDLVWLSAANGWSYVWDDPESAIASLASPSSAEDWEEDIFIPGEEPEPPPPDMETRWSVRQEEYWPRYETREEMRVLNIWVITNRLRPGGSLPEIEHTQPQESSPQESPPQESTPQGSDPFVPETLPEAPSETLPETLPEAPPETLPETLPEAPSETLPETLPETGTEAPPPRSGGREEDQHPGSTKHAEDTRKEKKAELEFIQSSSEDAQSAAGGAEIKYEILVRNKGDREAKGVWIRKYIPDYTHFSECDAGDYGCIEQKEHVTWFIPELAPKQEIILSFSVSKDYCIGGRIEGKLYYELRNSEEKPYANDRRNPANLY